MRSLRNALVVALLCVAVLAARPAAAAGGPFGLGIIIGSPTGLSGKYYFNRQNALDFALGAAFISSRGLHFHVDYLWHPVMLAQESGFFMPLYLGIGGRLLDHDNSRFADDIHLGARVPVGILFDFRNVPLDVFVEVALVVDFIQDHDHPDWVGLNAGLGLRYYF